MGNCLLQSQHLWGFLQILPLFTADLPSNGSNATNPPCALQHNFVSIINRTELSGPNALRHIPTVEQFYQCSCLDK